MYENLITPPPTLWVIPSLPLFWLGIINSSEPTAHTAPSGEEALWGMLLSQVTISTSMEGVCCYLFVTIPKDFLQESVGISGRLECVYLLTFACFHAKERKPEPAEPHAP